MQYSHEKSQAKEYAREAMARIEKESLPSTPDIFELWYVYYSGQSEGVKRAIDVLVSNRQPVSEERCRELHQRFLSEGRDEEAVRRAGEQMNTAIQDVSGVVRDVKSATTTYSGKLDGVSSRIEKIKDPSELKQILTSVMSDTHAMITHNHHLEQQLDQSSMVMEELQRDLENVRREAMTDGLTGLSNRKAFDMEIERIAQEARASGAPFTLMMFDIDHFKTFNDNFGHQVGDQVLRLVSRTMTDGIKGRDVAARYGGEEFVIILPETGIDAGIIVANTLRRAVAVKDIINRNTGEKLGRITLSVGVAEYDPSETIDDLIERADSALYAAKHNGRNQVASAPTPGKKKKKLQDQASAS